MAPKKKNAPNGFMIFTFEWKAKYGKGMSVPEATTEAGKIWAQMGPQERGPYNEQAKQGKLGYKDKSVKLTCTGQPVALVEKEKTDADQRERQMKRYIETTVRNSVKRNELEDQCYYFIMANYFTKTLRGGVFVPAEIAVCEYSLKEGVQRVFQTHVNPGVNIYGHQYEAQHHSDTTHKLPLPPNAMGETSLSGIYNEILDMVRCKKTGTYPPLYTNRDCIHVVESVLDFLMAEPGSSNTQLEIYSIQYLFYIMKEATCEVGEVEKPKSFFITDAFFERDHFEYTTGCNYHDDIDRNRYCTKSFVTRWGYIFSDYMCQDLAIAMIPERHVPKGTNLNAIINVPAPSTYNDSASYISLGTETSYATKALSEHKIYDERKSNISERTSSPAWASASGSFMNKFDGDEYPSLGGRGATRKKTAPVSSGAAKQTKGNKISKELNTYMEDNVGEDVDDMNPWASRSRHVPPQPSDSSVFEVDVRRDERNSSFDFSDIDDFNMLSGMGRGRDMNRSLNTTAASSYGRGRIFRS